MLNYLESNFGLGYDESALEDFAYKLTQMNNHRTVNIDDIISGAFGEHDKDGDFVP
jgi:hypothetical protein